MSFITNEIFSSSVSREITIRFHSFLLSQKVRRHNGPRSFRCKSLRIDRAKYEDLLFAHKLVLTAETLKSSKKDYEAFHRLSSLLLRNAEKFNKQQ